MLIKIMTEDLKNLNACESVIDEFESRYREYVVINWTRETQIETLKTNKFVQKYFKWAVMHNLLPVWNMKKADFEGANLDDARFLDLLMAKANLRHVCAMESCFNRTDLTKADLSHIYMPFSYLFQTKLTHAYLYEANLSHCFLTQAMMDCAYLKNVNLSRANLYNANLALTNLENANLENAQCLCADFYQADLTKANLRGADFTHANLSGANLIGANITGANFHQANLDGTCLDDKQRKLLYDR